MRKLLPSSLLVLLSFSISAFEPLSEDDMDGVSAEMGNNLYRVFGAPGAGRDNSKVKLVAAKEDEAGKIASSRSDGESESALSQEDLENPVEDAVDGTSVVNSYARSIVESELNGNESRTEYNNRNYSLETEFFDDGSVATTRDLFIDRLSIENLRGSDPTNQNTVGDIAISNWTSQGTIHVQER